MKGRSSSSRPLDGRPLHARPNVRLAPNSQKLILISIEPLNVHKMKLEIFQAFTQATALGNGEMFLKLATAVSSCEEKRPAPQAKVVESKGPFLPEMFVKSITTDLHPKYDRRWL